MKKKNNNKNKTKIAFDHKFEIVCSWKKLLYFGANTTMNNLNQAWHILWKKYTTSNKNVSVPLQNYPEQTTSFEIFFWHAAKIINHLSHFLFLQICFWLLKDLHYSLKCAISVHSDFYKIVSQLDLAYFSLKILP